MLGCVSLDDININIPVTLLSRSKWLGRVLHNEFEALENTLLMLLPVSVVSSPFIRRCVLCGGHWFAHSVILLTTCTCMYHFCHVFTAMTGVYYLEAKTLLQRYRYPPPPSLFLLFFHSILVYSTHVLILCVCMYVTMVACVCT